MFVMAGQVLTETDTCWPWRFRCDLYESLFDKENTRCDLKKPAAPSAILYPVTELRKDGKQLPPPFACRPCVRVPFRGVGPPRPKVGHLRLQKTATKGCCRSQAGGSGRPATGRCKHARRLIGCPAGHALVTPMDGALARLIVKRLKRPCEICFIISSLPHPPTRSCSR